MENKTRWSLLTVLFNIVLDEILAMEILQRPRQFTKSEAIKQEKEIFKNQELCWRSSGYDSMLPMQGTQVQSFVRELDATFATIKDSVCHNEDQRPGGAK